MKIRMLTGISGLDFTLVPKEETDRFSDGEALRLMLSDQAEPVDAEASAALKAGIAEREAEARDPLDHDGNGKKGGSKARASKAKAAG